MTNLRLSSFTYGPIVVKPVVPSELSTLLIPGSEAYSSEGPFGSILFQEVKAGDISIMYNIYQLKEDLAIDFQLNPGTLRTHVALKNDSQCYISGLGEYYLAEGQFNIIDATTLDGTYFLEHGEEYRTLHLSFSSQQLERMLPVFPYLQEWLASDSPQPRLLFKVHSWLSPQIKDVIDKILFCPYTDELQEYYRELKACELLCLALAPGAKEVTPAVKLTRHNVALIHESRHILDSVFDQHITISSIAQRTGMNEFKLRAGFKQVFGISMFDYLVKTRMQAARSLLLETDKPIKEIAALTGYATKQSFLNAFKKYFHDTPGAFRKN
jgi:AraC-like DNA-binding protein